MHVPRTDQNSPWYVHIPQTMVIYLYEHSMCMNVRLNALNVLQVHGPCFNAPNRNASFIQK